MAKRVISKNKLYFRGVLPFGQRKKLWEKYRAKSRKQRPSTTSEIVTGSQVCMKNSPMYQPGAVGKRLILKLTNNLKF